MLLSRVSQLAFVMIMLSTVSGCNFGPHEDPTIDEFNGQLMHKGAPVKFDPGEKVILRLAYHKRGERFGVPITPDGTFNIGWMPIGEYSADLERSGGKDGPRTAFKRIHHVPDGLTIAEGQTKYEIELGEGFKP